MNFQWKNTFVTLALIVEGATEEVSQFKSIQTTKKTFVVINISEF